MIRFDSVCYRNLQIGDVVIVKLLPTLSYGQFKKPIMFPVVGFYMQVPLLGTMSEYLYHNYRFNNTLIYGLQIHTASKWKYSMPLNVRHVQIEKIIKGGERWLRIDHSNLI